MPARDNTESLDFSVDLFFEPVLIVIGMLSLAALFSLIQ